MRKIITLLLTLVIMMPVSFSNAADTLFQYYYELGKKLPTISERSVIYAEIDSDFYSGTYAQNVKLLDYLQANKLGFSPTTNFTERLSSSISATDTEIPITSILDDDGIALGCSATNKCYFNIEQGTSKEERVVCSATTTTSVASCVRGLAATGNSEVGDSDRAYPHNAGSRIIMTNIAQFYGNYINLWDDQTKIGVLTFSDSPIVPSPTTATQAATKGYVDGVAQQSGATSTEAVVGLSQLATQAEMAATIFDANNPQVISTKYSTSSPGVAGHYAVITKADGDIDNDFLANDEALIRTGDTTLATTTFSGNVIGPGFGGNGSDGVLSVTSGTTTIALGSANVVIKNYASINIATGTELTFSGKATDGTILILKSQGDCTIAGQIDLVGMGADAATEGFGITDETSHKGGNGNTGNSGDEVGGAGGAAFSNKWNYPTADADRLYRRYMNVAAGSGGGNGGQGETSGGAGGAGGAGGGALIIECGGSLNFVAGSEILIDGSSGNVGGNSTSSYEGTGGGGGGGSAGMALVLYNYLTANSGTINARGGAGGKAGDTSFAIGGGGYYGGTGGGGAGGYSGAGSVGGDNSDHAICTAGTAGIGARGAGGGGGVGPTTGLNNTGCSGGAQGSTDSTHYLVTQNLYF